MLGHLTDRNFLGMVCGGMISHCPMTVTAVQSRNRVKTGADTLRICHYLSCADPVGDPQVTPASHVGG
jgi:hypothetical protein